MRAYVIIRYMSQVTYGILRICRVGFLRISERRSADVREPSAESSLVIRGIIWRLNVCLNVVNGGRSGSPRL